MLAEAVQIDGGTVVFLIVIGLAVLALAAATVVFGFVLAPRAARGSSAAMGWWVVILAVEGLGCLSSVAAIVTGNFSFGALVMPAIVGAQVAVFVRARRNAGG